jgi:hypothetical protein
LHRIEIVGLYALLATTVRCRHPHATAVAFHLFAASVLLRRHLSIGKGARHGRREQRQNQCKDNSQMMQPAHPSLE